MAAGGAQIVRQAKLAAIRAFLIVDRLQGIMAATHVALRRRSFSLGDGHPGTCSVCLEFMMRASGAPSHTAEEAAGLAAGARTWEPNEYFFDGNP